MYRFMEFLFSVFTLLIDYKALAFGLAQNLPIAWTIFKMEIPESGQKKAALNERRLEDKLV